jgi:hypothetical protein
MFLCPSVCSLQQIFSHRKDIHEILYNSILRKTFSLNITTKRGTLYEEKYTFFILSLSVLLRMRKVSVIFIAKLETHNSSSMNIFQKIVMFMRWCTIISYGQTGHRKRYVPCTVLAGHRKAVITHSEYVIYIYFPLQKWQLESDFLLRYT